MNSINQSQHQMTIHQNWIGTTYLICSCGYFREFPFMYPLNALVAATKHKGTITIYHKETYT
jgi:hypothetical protein